MKTKWSLSAIQRTLQRCVHAVARARALIVIANSIKRCTTLNSRRAIKDEFFLWSYCICCRQSPEFVLCVWIALIKRDEMKTTEKKMDFNRAANLWFSIETHKVHGNMNMTQSIYLFVFSDVFFLASRESTTNTTATTPVNKFIINKLTWCSTHERHKSTYSNSQTG